MAGDGSTTRGRKLEEFLAALFFMAMGAVYVHTSFDYGIGSSREPGSGYFPLILGVLMVGLSAILALRSIAGRSVGGLPRWPVRQLLLIVGSLVTFGLLIGGVRALGFDGLGLIPAMVCMGFIAGLATSDLSLRQNALLALILAAGSWAIFVKFLGLVIPLWPWSY